MNPKVEKISAEIEKLKAKISSNQARLRDLERQKTEIENADIISMVRGVDIDPADFNAFVRMFKEKQGNPKNPGVIVPDLPLATHGEKTKIEKEDTPLEN